MSSRPEVAVAELPPSQTMGIGSSRTHRSRQEAVGWRVLPKLRKTVCEVHTIETNANKSGKEKIIREQEISRSIDTIWLVVQACI